MTILYAMTLSLGLIGVVGWIVLSTVSATVRGWASADPEIRFGKTGRTMVAALVGSGMGGLSATFAGWPDPASIGGAVAGAVGLGIASHLLGPTGRPPAGIDVEP